MINELLNIPEKQLSVEEYREWITQAEKNITEKYETTDRHGCISHGYTLKEAFTPGIYVRELTMPAGSIVFSRIHKQQHPYMITKGKVSVYDGNEIQLIEAVYKGVTQPGTKRVLYNHEETTWITFHPVNDDDIAEDMALTITCDTFEEFDKLELIK